MSKVLLVTSRAGSNHDAWSLMFEIPGPPALDTSRLLVLQAMYSTRTHLAYHANLGLLLMLRQDFFEELSGVSSCRKTSIRIANLSSDAPVTARQHSQRIYTM